MTLHQKSVSSDLSGIYWILLTEFREGLKKKESVSPVQGLYSLEGVKTMRSTCRFRKYVPKPVRYNGSQKKGEICFEEDFSRYSASRVSHLIHRLPSPLRYRPLLICGVRVGPRYILVSDVVPLCRTPRPRSHSLSRTDSFRLLCATRL